jgi:hypothetical protein
VKQVIFLARWHYNARYFDCIALQVALEANGMPSVLRKVREVLVLDVVYLTRYERVSSGRN